MQVLPQSFDLNSPAWLKSLRWLALLGISGTILGSKFLIGAELNWLLLAGILSALAIWNFSLRWLEKIYALSSRGYVLFQISVDLFALTAILWLSGGLLNPFASFYIFHVMIAGLLLDRRSTIAVSALTILFVLSLIFAGPILLHGKSYVLQDSPVWIGIPIALSLLIIFSTAFILGFMYRLGVSQEESQQREKMAALGRLVSGLAHELGTPLNVIMLLATDLADEARGQIRKDLDTIIAQAKRCGDLVGILLGYSRTSMAIGAPAEIDLIPWLRDIFAGVRKEFAGDSSENGDSSDNGDSSENIELCAMVNLADTKILLPELVLRQVLTNLFRNSLQAMQGRGNGRLDIEVREQADSEQLQFLIKDSGPGFTEESRARAFEAFYSTKGPGKGDGLGLYISYHMIEQLGGKILIPQELQTNGAVVEILIPYKE